MLGVSGRIFVISLATLEPLNSIATNLSGSYSKLKFQSIAQVPRAPSVTVGLPNVLIQARSDLILGLDLASGVL